MMKLCGRSRSSVVSLLFGRQYTGSNTKRGDRLFVYNLPDGLDWKALKDHFAAAGEIGYAKILLDKETNASKKCGIVVLDDPTKIESVIAKMNGSLLQGAVIGVRKEIDGEAKDQMPWRVNARTPTASRPIDEAIQHRVFITGLPPTATWMDLKDHFREQVGEVSFAATQKNATGECRGFGIVEFADKENVKVACAKLHHQIFLGGKITVRPDKPPKRNQNREEEE
jgi:RNA recognition motif-containing protein